MEMFPFLKKQLPECVFEISATCRHSWVQMSLQHRSNVQSHRRRGSGTRRWDHECALVCLLEKPANDSLS